ncbi:hypothetical protein [Phenylobacterium sp.]|jgi:ferric-dicitrate binding protein FerR (iron transport regulator)|uniref:hypothetical protein n=1 Tax=Phenylobacterium sp. TaxID=1871053 RepID=UPI002F9369A9
MQETAAALSWYNRLNVAAPSAATIREFKAWAADPANAPALGHLQWVWRLTCRGATRPDLQSLLLARGSASACPISPEAG